jgi:hypothetical protein
MDEGIGNRKASEVDNREPSADSLFDVACMKYMCPETISRAPRLLAPFEDALSTPLEWDEVDPRLDLAQYN